MKKALYRRFRPQTFDEVYDQGNVTAVLKNQVKTKNIGHAYLFSGTRGTGKTSCAKIFARAVNCLHPVNGNPCNECENCRAILDETTMDVVEMDAASNRRIDDIRELRDKVIYPPATLKYKVYIIDEAHMITKEAFNALLKIMEEPPEHLIFILATTEIDSIPITILSRTQRYEFKRIELGAIEENLKRIAIETGVEISDEASHSLAVMADGAMRDALSLFDQVIAGNQKVITQDIIDKILGTVGFDRVYILTKHIFENDSKSALLYLEEIFGDGKDAGTLLKELLEYFRNLLIFMTTQEESFLQMNSEQKDCIRELVKNVSVQRILDSIEILLYADEQIKKSDYAEILLEAAIVRLVNFVSDKDMLSRLESVESKTKAIERWQIPENMILREVREYIRSLDIGKMLPAGEAISKPKCEAINEVKKNSAGKNLPEKVSADIISEIEILPDVETISEHEILSEIPKVIQVEAENDNEFAFFEDNPEEWLQDHKEHLFSEFESIGVRREFFSNYKRVILRGNILTFVFPETYSFVARMISMHTAEMENIFNKAIGKRYSMTFCPESEVKDLEELVDKEEIKKEDSTKIKKAVVIQEENSIAKKSKNDAVEKVNEKSNEEISEDNNEDVNKEPDVLVGNKVETLDKLKKLIPSDILNVIDEN